LIVEKVGGGEANIAEALTKYVDAKDLAIQDQTRIQGWKA